MAFPHVINIEFLQLKAFNFSRNFITAQNLLVEAESGVLQCKCSNLRFSNLHTENKNTT